MVGVNVRSENCRESLPAEQKSVKIKSQEIEKLNLSSKVLMTVKI